MRYSLMPLGMTIVRSSDTKTLCDMRSLHVASYLLHDDQGAYVMAICFKNKKRHWSNPHPSGGSIVPDRVEWARCDS